MLKWIVTRATRHRARAAFLLTGALLLMLSACGDAAESQNETQPVKANNGEVTLVIGAYSVVKDAFGDLLPAFQKYWLEKTGQKVVFQESYEASGTQARAIVGGFEADVAALAMQSDVEKIQKAGLITYDWSNTETKGMMTNSLVVLGTRDGNPKGIHGWEDLTRKGVKVLYPNPKTSGGAQWDINAIYGAGLKKSEQETGAKDPEYAKQFLKDIHANIESLDKSGRASMAAFEYGVGDVIVTYENELRARIKQGVPYTIVVPESTILIENPVAVVDKNAAKHGVKEVAQAFVDYLVTDDAQRTLSEYGFRPVNKKVAEETKAEFIQPAQLFDIQYLGGWKQVRETLYSKKGVWYQVLAGI
ncbi:sulfate ABC transporter, periplasmic sulfate-binding protein [Paenibacillus curdlanolyticus YK9]|uniref:Sulfate ABC transporter, periplasmic sulfate-binding protein n=1 Tax=Paenibacillus curdlanolyticus YK9 TaxID=717606 RepID=E0I6R4_9BACL|nr:sulfate ABC transporter substrate-binding protein [Paenibacillus curdlanolyticus]EFM11730.1 sulfate ABC transporter, periplasmic sulfate-binding protein [Paenibacillus curdlanolyticus YK9]